MYIGYYLKNQFISMLLSKSKSFLHVLVNKVSWLVGVESLKSSTKFKYNGIIILLESTNCTKYNGTEKNLNSKINLRPPNSNNNWIIG